MIVENMYKNALNIIRTTLREVDFVSDADKANLLVDEAMMYIDLVLMGEDNEESNYCGSPAVDL